MKKWSRFEELTVKTQKIHTRAFAHASYQNNCLLKHADLNSKEF